MSAGVVATRIELPGDGLRSAVDRIGQVRSAWPGGPLEAWAGPVPPDGAFLWLIVHDRQARAGQAGALGELACQRIAPDRPDAVVACSGRLLADDFAGSADAGRWILPVPYAVPTADLDDLDGWYEHEHVDLLVRCEAWLRVRRFEIEEIVGADWNRLILHDLAEPEVMNAPQVRESMKTPWRSRLADTPWFNAGGRHPAGRV